MFGGLSINFINLKFLLKMKTNYLKRGIRLGIPMILIAMVVVLTTRCSNEFTSDTQEEVLAFGESPILQFNSYDELMAEAKRTLNFTLEQLKAEEEAKGYVSFGRMADEIYEQALTEDFGSFAELEIFVENNSDYLQIIVGEDGEKVLETRFYNNLFRYVMNKDRMYQIEKKVFKRFENGVANVAIQDMDELMKINTFNYESKNANIEFATIKNNLVQKTYSNKNAVIDCGPAAGTSVTNGNQRTELGLSTYYDNGKVIIHCTVTAKKKLPWPLGWVKVSRYMRAYVDVAVDYYTEFGGPITHYLNASLDNYDTKKWSAVEYIDTNFPAQSVEFKAYFAFGDTGSTDPAAELECNKDLVCPVGPGPVLYCPNPNPPSGGFPPGGGSGTGTGEAPIEEEGGNMQ